MADLINRSSLKQSIKRGKSIMYQGEHYIPLHTVLGKVLVAPAVDAEPVVRCRDCKYWSGRNDKTGEVTAIGYCNHPNHHIMPLNAGWFCADGAKMDGGAEVD